MTDDEKIKFIAECIVENLSKNSIKASVATQTPIPITTHEVCRELFEEENLMLIANKFLDDMLKNKYREIVFSEFMLNTSPFPTHVIRTPYIYLLYFLVPQFSTPEIISIKLAWRGIL